VVLLETKFSDGYEYNFALPCTVCDVKWHIHRAFGQLAASKETAGRLRDAILKTLAIRPVKTDGNANARDGLRKLLMDPHDAPSVILTGPPGTGKTFLGMHCLKAIAERHRRPVLFLQEYVFLRAWRLTHDTINANDRAWGVNLIERARSCAMLMIDDFGQTRNTSAGGIDALEALIMHRYDSKLNVIVTTNRSVEGLRDARGDRVVSRLAGLSKGMFISCMGDDWRLCENG
jgi:DNA replication protein DnaC